MEEHKKSDTDGSSRVFIPAVGEIACHDDKSSQLMHEIGVASELHTSLIWFAITYDQRENLDNLLSSDRGLVEAPVDYNMKVDDQDMKLQITPLVLAAALGRSEVMDIILKRGANINAKIPIIGGTALHLAVERNHSTCVESLLQGMVDINCQNKKGMTSLHIASIYGRVHIAIRLIEAMADLSIRDNYGRTAFLMASTFRQKSILELLFQRASTNQMMDQNNFGNNALHIASIRNYPDVVQYLLNMGAPINEPNKNNCAPLYLASLEGSKETAEVLLNNNANISQRNVDDMTAFMIASRQGHVDILQLLWDRGPKSQILDRNALSTQALHLSVIRNHPKATRLLLDLGAPVEEPGIRVANPLHLAVANGSQKALKVLLEYRADVNKKNSTGDTPILLACFQADMECFEILADVSRISSVNNHNNTCFHNVVNGKKLYSWQHYQLITRLVGYGLDINQANIFGDSPLSRACALQKHEFVKALLDMGADINFVSPVFNVTALMVACTKQDTEIVETLMRRKADTTKKNHHGLTALALACRFGFLATVGILLQGGASVTVRDRKLHTPLFTAAEQGHIDIVLEILATQDYYPQSPVRMKSFMEPLINLSTIENALKKGLADGKIENLRQIEIVMFWALTNGCLDLARQCVERNAELLKWNKQGATLLHVAAKYGRSEIIQDLLFAMDSCAEDEKGTTPLHIAASSGSTETTELLLKMVATQNSKSPAWEKAMAITKWDSHGESPLTVAIQKKVHSVTTVFWTHIGDLEHESCMDIEPTGSVQLLEILAQYEKPGHEDTLRQLLKGWFKHLLHVDDKNWTALDWAVHTSQAVVVWWLLAKGGFTSGEHLRGAQRLAQQKTSREGSAIRMLLENPPPILNNIANPSDDHITPLPKLINKESSSLKFKGSIVDVLSRNDRISVRYSKPVVKDLIYEQGPDAIMKRARDLHQWNLDDLRNRIQDTQHQEPPNHFLGEPTHSQQGSVHKPSPELQSKSPNMSKRHESPRKDLQLRWIHLPVNELPLMRDLLVRLSHDSERSEMDHSFLMKHFNQSWTELEAGEKRHFMKPQYVHRDLNNSNFGDGNQSDGQEPATRNACAALYMPYLGFGTYRPGDESNPAEADALEESINSRNWRQIKHKPLSLDQYYYSSLKDTAKRDKDQVISRFIKAHNGSPFPGYHSAHHTRTEVDRKVDDCKILLVNQLWIWVIDKETIVTATAEIPGQNSEANAQNERSLHKLILDSMIHGASKSRFERPTSIESMMEMILGIATGYFVKKSVPVLNNEFKGPCEIFRESIREVADKEIHLFNEFVLQLSKEKAEQKQGREKLRTSHTISQVPQNPYHIISDETDLLYEIRDIIDELRMLKSIAEDQSVVWRQVFQTDGLKDSFRYYHSCTPYDVKKDINEMLEEAQTARDSINTLLDLRQKQATIKEAEFGREQANHTAQQSNSIFIFTVITILFLPLSFLSSLFALDVSDFPHDHESGDLRYQGRWLFPIMFGVSAAVSIPCIIMAWKVNDISKSLSKEQEHTRDRRKDETASWNHTREAISRMAMKVDLKRRRGRVDESKV